MRAVAAELTCIEGALKRRTAYVAHGMHGMIRQQHAAGMHGVCMAGANLRRDAAHALAVQMPRASTATGGVTAQAPFPPALTLVQQVQQTILPPMHLQRMLPSQQQMVLLPVVRGACTTLTTLRHVAVRLQQLQAAGT